MLQEVTRNKSPSAVLFRLAMPISLSRLLHVFGHFIAMMMVARLGEKPIAAGSLAVSSYITILTLSTSIFYAIGIRIRYQNQQSTPSQIADLIRNALFLAFVIAIPAALSLAYMDKLLILFHQDVELVALTHDYFGFASLGLFPVLLLTVILQFYLGTGKARVTLWLEVFSLPLTALLSYGLVLGHFGLPQLGLAGVSLANLLVQLILLISMAVIFLRQNSLYPFFSQSLKPDWPICQGILKLGLPIGLQFGGELAVMALSTYLMGYFGTHALAALQITNQYALVIFMLNFGLSQALALKISEEQRLHEGRASTLLFAALQLLLTYMLPVVVIFCFFSKQLTHFYLGNAIQPPFFYPVTQAFFILSAVFLFIDGLRNLLSSALRGFHDSEASSRINLLCLWGISLPVSAVAAFNFHGGPIALRIGFLSGFIVAVVLLGRNLLNKIRRINDFNSIKLQEGGYHA